MGSDDESATVSPGGDGLARTSETGPGTVTTMGLVSVQVNETGVVEPAPSLTVTVTGEVPDVVGVPAMSPALEPMDRPPGRPVAV